MFEINGVVWGVCIVSPNHPELRPGGQRRAIGCCNPSKRMIYISEAVVGSPLFRQVLYHEVAHAAVASYGITLPLDEEEFLASFISIHGDEISEVVNSLL